ncbi:hypothetical protein PSV09DRAFT_2345216 [Bipolaris maydis]|uniref:uncharacterized protein n=1 Tax=Cochliobolus heterostrophus TaxID=5016 RepID=UPI0024D5E69E|nr:hypothetical protein J3E73DRAFT_294464 [Bipolaris maydis]KAJ5062387.1 hypothetical protein J3E74DRAFT_321537 [Bipolaris maydis]KAJ6204559.1 hypothetical protein PSV09DRAFT_2345216 [Bipolaris maydis]KAJ6266724.1 hypothetical protein PSV08DRAFT_333744 [Bipolaris maydis]
MEFSWSIWGVAQHFSLIFFSLSISPRLLAEAGWTCRFGFLCSIAISTVHYILLAF